MKKYIGTVIAALILLALIVLSVVLNGQSLSGLQKSTLKILLIVCGCSAAYCFIAGELTKNYSQMDKLWSMLPIAYLWIVAVKSGMNVRILVFALVVTAWGVRLTVNFARKGAYRLKFWTGNEDYRWSIVHAMPFFQKKGMWTLFDLFFISIYQNLLVLAICLPAVACMESMTPFGLMDFAALALSVSFLALETVADEYQWRFHQKKRQLLSEGKQLEDLPSPYDLGFNTRGPWGYMRHPNYLGEQGMWASFYLFVIGAGETAFGVFNWSFLGALFLVLLFMGSSALGEKISSGKYPKYKDYISQVFKYLPLRKFDPGKDAGVLQKGE